MKKRTKQGNKHMSINNWREEAKRRYLKDLQITRKLAEEQNSIDVQPIRIIRNNGDEEEEEIVPIDVMIQVFTFLTPRELCFKVGLVCKGWNYISIRCNRIWKYLYVVNFEPRQMQKYLDEAMEEDEPEAASFSAQWIKKFSQRLLLRSKWRKNKPHSQGFLDLLSKEVKNERERDHMFSKNQYLVGQENPDVDKRTGYFIDVTKRSTVQYMVINGDRLISTDVNNSIKIWNLRTYQMLFTIQNPSLITSIAASATNIYVASENSIFVYDMKNGLLLADLRSSTKRADITEFYGLNQTLKSVNRPVLKIALEEGLLFATTQSSIEIYDISSGSFKYSLLLKRTKPKRSRFATSLPLIGDENDDDQQQNDAMTDIDQPEIAGTNIVSQDGVLVVQSGESILKFYDVDTGICTKTLNILDIFKRKRPNATPPQIVVKYMKLIDINLIAIVAAYNVVDPNGGIKSDYYLQYYNYAAGVLLKNQGCKIRLPSTAQNMYQPGDFAFSLDSDKIVVTQTNGNITWIVDVNSGYPQCTIPNNVTAHYASISTSLATETQLVHGLSFGGIVVNDFGGSQFYWKGLQGRTLLSDDSNSGEQSASEPMDESQ